VGEWKGGKPLLLAGGVDEGETVKEGVLREVLEEGGLYDFKHIQKIETSYAHYFNTAKKVNRVARAECYAIVLNSTDTKEVVLEDHEDFELAWWSAEDIRRWWVEHDDEDGFKHYIRFLDESVAWLIKEGYDNTSDPSLFVSSPVTEQGTLENSGEFDGLTSEEARIKITEKVGGELVTNYRLQDWTFSRQRYWGEPIPIVFDKEGAAYPLAESELPLKLPEVESYEPTGTGESPLAGITDWVNVKGKIVDGEFVTDESGEEFRRETNTMPQWAGSSWYYLRYMDPKNDLALVDGSVEKDFMPVDVYVGGVEHATRHLIYARFWHKFLFDIGVVSTKEPFMELHSPGLILAEDGRKMSKRWGNTINPDEMVDRFGADSFRLYEMFMGPFENTVAWNTDGVVGTRRFVEKVWRIQDKLGANNPELDPILHETIQKVSRDIPAFKFNTCVSAMMICASAFDNASSVGKDQYKLFIQLLAPFAPHMAEELWRGVLGETESIHLSQWPEFDPEKIKTDTVTLVVQINGKVRAKLEVTAGLSQDEVMDLARTNESVQKWLDGEPKKVIHIQDKLLNIVV
jgi:leucyl-tRNA synthetase